MKKITSEDTKGIRKNESENKIHMKFFMSGGILIFIGIILISIPGFVPTPESHTGEYLIYSNVVDILATIRRLLVNAGLLLIASGLFLGASLNENLSEHAQRGMYIAMGLVLFGLVLNIAFTGIFGF